MNSQTVNKIDDPQTLDLLIRHHQEVVGLLEKRAIEVRRQTDMQDRNKKRNGELRSSPARVSYYLERGHSLGSAIDKTADDLATFQETIQSHWNRFMRSRKKQETRDRELMVARLAARKLNDQTIASKTGLHVKSVSRILRRATA